MQLAAVVDELHRVGFDPQRRTGAAESATLELHDASHDSRTAGPGVIFCAVPGATVDGHDYAARAVDAGTPALLVERWLDVDVPQIRVDNVRESMAFLAAAIHDFPSRDLAVFGITGTNGKTTTTHLLASIMRHAGRTVQVLGTLDGVHTTPEATDLQRRLRSEADSGVQIVAAEISSHALDQCRADALDFAVAAFSNLTPDHLDYHGDMEAYFEAKIRLFDGRAAQELINIDDPWGARLATARPNAVALSLAATEVLHADGRGTSFRWRGRDVRVPIPGQMNVANALMAAEAAVLLGVDEDAVSAGLDAVPQVPGRMELASDPGDSLTVLVDYSHTPDSIERALASIRAASPTASVTIVFGCGGDRDRSKRPLMAAAAEQGADLVIVTSDNPRSEDPQAIIDEAVAGLSDPSGAITELDRRAAIAIAIDQTPAGGVVLVAGKGHERTQTIGDQVLPFDDVAVSRDLLEERAR